MYRANAKTKRRALELLDEQMIELFRSSCFYCGAAAPSTLNGIDRLDSNLDYVSSNVVACCAECNEAKMDRSQDEFEAWICRAYSHISKRGTVCQTL
jgi:hypothetical protein